MKIKQYCQGTENQKDYQNLNFETPFTISIARALQIKKNIKPYIPYHNNETPITRLRSSISKILQIKNNVKTYILKHHFKQAHKAQRCDSITPETINHSLVDCLKMLL